MELNPNLTEKIVTGCESYIYILRPKIMNAWTGILENEKLDKNLFECTLIRNIDLEFLQRTYFYTNKFIF